MGSRLSLLYAIFDKLVKSKVWAVSKANVTKLHS